MFLLSGVYDSKFMKTFYELRMNIFHQMLRKKRAEATTLLYSKVRSGNFNEEAAENKFDADLILWKFSASCFHNRTNIPPAYVARRIGPFLGKEQEFVLIEVCAFGSAPTFDITQA